MSASAIPEMTFLLGKFTGLVLTSSLHPIIITHMTLGKVHYRFTVVVSVLCSLLVFLVGCSKSKHGAIRTVEGSPEALYKEGLALFNKRLYSDALKKFEEIKSTFPDSPPYTVWAELKVADCHFFDKNYVQAIAAYEEFRKIHPTHEEMPYVQYQIGMSYYEQMRSSDRDQTPTRKALSNFEYLVANYPPSLFTEKAKEKIVICRERLADHEFNVGMYYYRRNRYAGAVQRFRTVLDEFSDTPGQDRVLFFLGQCYLELGQAEQARQAFSRIVADYPSSSFYRQSKAILEEGVKTKESMGKKDTSSKRDGIFPETKEVDQDRLALVKFLEEGRRPVSLKEGPKAREMQPGAIPLAEEAKPSAREGAKPAEVRETRTQREGEPSDLLPLRPREALASKSGETSTAQGEPRLPRSELRPKPTPGLNAGESVDSLAEREAEKEPRRLNIKVDPALEGRRAIPLQVGDREQLKPEKKTKTEVFDVLAALSQEKRDEGKTREGDSSTSFDTTQPIDITSDTVEALAKDNLIVFKGNVAARQKDMVIYADVLEALIIGDGKGIERVTAHGNVKIQQGLRVANCQKAIYYNLDRKVVLTGDPRVYEGDNMVSGEEIIVDMEQNRVEVKGGPGGRGKVKIQP